LSLLVLRDEPAEATEVLVDGVAAQPQQSRRASGIQVATEAFHYFSNTIFA
jgi:hypothetical protein